MVRAMQYQTGLAIAAALRQILQAEPAQPATLGPIRAAALNGTAPAPPALVASPAPRAHA